MTRRWRFWAMWAANWGSSEAGKLLHSSSSEGLSAQLTVVIRAFSRRVLQLRSDGGAVVLQLWRWRHAPFVGGLKRWREKYDHQRTVHACVTPFMNPTSFGALAALFCILLRYFFETLDFLCTFYVIISCKLHYYLMQKSPLLLQLCQTPAVVRFPSKHEESPTRYQR